ncbi:MAG: PilZ domain-containing protein [Pseudolabrys sp.]|jgi:PilZ domain-containing protein
MLKERRKQERFAINRAAKYRVEPRDLLRECLITDISRDGARLFADGVMLPDQFELVISGADGLTRRCTVIWRLGGEVGVKFVGGGLPNIGPAFER